MRGMITRAMGGASMKYFLYKLIPPRSPFPEKMPEGVGESFTDDCIEEVVSSSNILL